MQIKAAATIAIETALIAIETALIAIFFLVLLFKTIF